jgi:SAM-dependent methyltransferase
MHHSAMLNAHKFAKKYINTTISQSVLDVGSWDGGNGNLRTVFDNSKYIGLDVQHGPNVDITYDSEHIPFSDNTFDIVVSSSCFEHVEHFWNLFLEMTRVLKIGGYMYINAPSSGPYHPEYCISDSWRFYPDSWRSLCRWANKNNYSLSLIESYIDTNFYPPDQNWQDSVGIFQKNNV